MFHAVGQCLLLLLIAILIAAVFVICATPFLGLSVCFRVRLAYVDAARLLAQSLLDSPGWETLGW